MSQLDDSKWLVREGQKKAKKARTSGRMLRLPLGVQRYIKTRGTPQGVYELVRTVNANINYASGFVVGGSTVEGMSFSFTPQNVYITAGNNPLVFNQYSVPAASELAAIWNMCKIDKVEIIAHSSMEGSTNTQASQPLILCAFDDKDTNATADRLRQMNCKSWMPGSLANNQHKVIIRPKYQRLVYYNSVTSSYEPTQGYIVTDTDIPHYAYKMAMGVSGQQGTIFFTFKIHYKLKDLK